MRRSSLPAFSLLLAGLLTAARVGGAEPPPRMDALGDPLPAGARARLGTVRLRHGGMVIACVYSPDGKTIASCGWDNLVRLWDAASGKEVRRFVGSELPIYSVVFSPDGKLLLSAGQEKVIRVWDVATGKEVRQITGHAGGVGKLAVSPDGKLLASAGHDKTERLWELETGKEVRQFPSTNQSEHAVLFSPDGKVLASTDSTVGVRLRDVATGEEIRPPLDTKHGIMLAYSPDGKLLAVTAGNLIHIWDVAAGKQVLQLKGHENNPWPVLFSKDGKTLISGGSDRLLIWWDVATGKELRRNKVHRAGVPRLALSPDGQTVVSCSHDGTLRLWDAKTGEERAILEGHRTGSVLGMAFSPDGHTLATAGDMTRLWDVSAVKEVRRLDAADQLGMASVAFSGDGKKLAAGGSGQLVYVWDAASGKELHRLAGHRSHVGFVGFAAADKLLVSADNVAPGAVHVWDAVTGKELRKFEGSPRGANGLVLSPDGRLLAASSATAPISLWEPDSGRLLRTLDGHTSAAISLAFAPDGRALAGAVQGGAVTVWEVATGKVRRRLAPLADLPAATQGGDRARFEAQWGKVAALSYSPDGRLLALGCSDGSIRLHETSTGKERRRFTGHEAGIRCLAFAPDGTLMASGSADSTVLLWDLAGLGDGPRPLADLAARQLDALWDDLAGADASKADDAIHQLAAAPAQAVPLLRDRLGPADSAVDPKQVSRWIADLDADAFAVREKASRELEKLGRLAEPALQEALKGQPSVEVRRRIQRLFERMQAPALTPEQLRAVRAVEVLERVGTPEARQALEKLAAGAAEADLTREAKQALERLARREKK